MFLCSTSSILTKRKIDDDGLGTIILFGGQVDLQAEIDKHTVLETQRKSEWENAQEKLTNYQVKNNPLSPEYHLDKIRAMLKKPGGWSETDSKIKGNKSNSAVKDDVLFEICRLKPSDTIDNLKKQFEEKKDLLDKISDSSLSFSPLPHDRIHIEDDLEEIICNLLSQTIEKPVLTEREKLILAQFKVDDSIWLKHLKIVLLTNQQHIVPIVINPFNRNTSMSCLQV